MIAKRLFFIGAILYSIVVKSQTPTIVVSKIKYSYDVTGNRIFRGFVSENAETTIDNEVDNSNVISRLANNHTTDKNVDAISEDSLFESIFKASIYPNPFTQIINVRIEQMDINNHAVLYVFETNGKLVFSENLRSTHSVFDLSKFQEGQYIAVIKSGESEQDFRIIKLLSK